MIAGYLLNTACQSFNVVNPFVHTLAVKKKSKEIEYFFKDRST